MDPYTYTDIFATKGIEYIVVIAFLVLLIPFWRALNRHPEALRTGHRAGAALPDLMYSRFHSWASLRSPDHARVGADDFLLRMTGDIAFKPLKDPGTFLQKGEVMATLGADGKRLHLYAPISGLVVDVNRAPVLDHGDHPGKGWIYGLQPTRWEDESRRLMRAGEASSWLRKETVRLRDFFSLAMASRSHEPAMLALQEGGELRGGLLEDMGADVWTGFQERFLDA